MDIRATYENRLEAMRQNFVLGKDFDSVLEMLPADPAPCAESAGSAPSADDSRQNGPRALTGGPLRNFPSLQYTGGFDGGTTVNYFGAWQNPEMFARFSDWKELAKLADERGEDFFHQEGALRFQVLPYGSNRGVNFKFIFLWESFTILISSRISSNDLPAVQVDYSYESFRNCDLFTARNIVESFLMTLGFKWERVSFQRVDINVTIDEEFSKVSTALNDGRFLSRIRKFHPVIDNTSQGLIWRYIMGGGASSEVSVRIYDKLNELDEVYNEQKLEDLRQVMGEADNLLRCEFSITSAFFRSIDVNSYEELEKRLPDIVEYLVFSWLRVLKTKKVRGKENKQELDEFWQKIQYAFYNVFINKTDIRPIIRRKEKRISRDPLLRQAVGCITAAMARTINKRRSLDEFLSDVFSECLNYKKLIYKVYRKKRLEYETRIFNAGVL